MPQKNENPSPSLLQKSLIRHMIICFLAVLVSFTSVLSSQKTEEFVEPWEERHNKNQPPEKIMDAIGLKPGMVIGDIGAGKGRFTVWFADRVGETGRVYANDIVENYLRYINKRCEQLGLSNVITCLGAVERPNIPDKVLDIAFMINVYHHLEKPVELLKNLRPTLKPDGTLVIVEHDPEKSGWPSESTSREDMINQANQAGYELVRVETFLPKDNIYFFKVKESILSKKTNPLMPIDIVSQ